MVAVSIPELAPNSHHAELDSSNAPSVRDDASNSNDNDATETVAVDPTKPAVDAVRLWLRLVAIS